MNERKLDSQSAQKVHEQNAQVKREAVRRQWRQGKADWQIGEAVGLGARAVARIREELGLKANKAGGR